MRVRALGSVGLLVVALWGGHAQAAPDNGLGLYLGAISSRDSSLYGNSTGGFLQADVQFIVNERWSLNPYLLLGSESTDQSFNIETGEGGLQARYWMGGSTFLAGQFLFHDNLLSRNGSVSASLYGPGIGMAAGWEGDNHWSVMVGANVYRLWSSYGRPATTRSEAMLLVGYRWGGKP